MTNSNRLQIRLLCCGVLLVAACGSEQAAEAVDDAPPPGLLRDVPLFPLSAPSTVAGTSESIEESYASMAPADTIAGWYRRTLGDQGWDVVSDAKMPDGSITIFAQRGGAPLWVMIEPRANGGTLYRIVAAAPNSE